VNGYREIAFEIANEAKKYAMSVNDEPNLPGCRTDSGIGKPEQSREKISTFSACTLFVQKTSSQRGD
jgi:hypothetical protein